MTLALVIPVHNDQEALVRLLDGAGRLGCFDQIVVVDDGSKQALTLPEMPNLPIDLLRHEAALGPGPARNAGLDLVRCSHVLFFDSDDLLTSEMPRLWRALQGQDFDFCQFRHADSRGLRQGDWRQMPLDEALWQQAGLSGRALSEVRGDARALLAQTANYPWNKIYRVEFLQAAKIRFPDLPVHEDIAPHWLSFARAGRILASDRVGAVHFIHEGGARQTNRRDAQRLRALDTLGQVWVGLETQALRLGFLRFCDGLFDWIYGVIEPVLRDPLARGIRRLLRGLMTPDLAETLITQDPVLARNLMLRMDAEAAPC